MTDKVTLTFFHNPTDGDDRSDVIDACIELFEELKKNGFDVSDPVVGSHPYKEEEEMNCKNCGLPELSDKEKEMIHRALECMHDELYDTTEYYGIKDVKELIRKFEP